MKKWVKIQNNRIKSNFLCLFLRAFSIQKQQVNFKQLYIKNCQCRFAFGKKQVFNF